MGKVKDISGQKFGRLTVIELVSVSRKCGAVWKCVCECGSECEIRGSKMRSGHTQSCGCKQKEAAAFTGKSATIHGERNTRLYRIHQGIKTRCNCPSSSGFKNYGARGIKVCDEWNDYSAFRDWALNSGYDDSMEIDRIDVSGNYCPQNCRWVTRSLNQRNKRNTIFITYNGVKKTAKEWSSITGIKYSTILSRLRKGMKESIL